MKSGTSAAALAGRFLELLLFVTVSPVLQRPDRPVESGQPGYWSIVDELDRRGKDMGRVTLSNRSCPADP
ncbi:hypothetical protein ACFXPI_35245 [Streptomyces sp. NPDC059104]|uniref:hypothetical protein n=1 Tax=Streptomyces sp. NPDC059104 TaxID=3346729 RepID=UPI0036C3F1B7